jgi:hypothetical protein
MGFPFGADLSPEPADLVVVDENRGYADSD